MAAKYKLGKACVIRVEDHAFIPLDAANRDYQEFLCYQKRGGEILSADRCSDKVYLELRKGEYPAQGDQLDVIMKMAARLRKSGIDIGPDAEEWISRCKAVKAKYSKAKRSAGGSKKKGGVVAGLAVSKKAAKKKTGKPRQKKK